MKKLLLIVLTLCVSATMLVSLCACNKPTETPASSSSSVSETSRGSQTDSATTSDSTTTSASDSASDSTSTSESASESHTHVAFHHDAVASTCAVAGNVEYWSCNGCSKLFTNADCTTETTLSAVTLAKLAHTAVHHDAVTATCTTAGMSEYWECSVCEKVFSNEACTTETTLTALTLPMAHTAVKTEKVAPTCSVAGCDEYWTCSSCSKIFAESTCTTETTLTDLAIPATGHYAGYVYDRSASFEVTGAGTLTIWALSSSSSGTTRSLIVGKYPMVLEADATHYAPASYTGDVMPTMTYSIPEAGKYQIGVVGDGGINIFRIQFTLTGETTPEFLFKADTLTAQTYTSNFTDVATGIEFICSAEKTIAVDTSSKKILNKNDKSINRLKFGGSTSKQPDFTLVPVCGRLVCVECGQEFGDSAPHNETPIHHEATNATCTSTGNVEYWECPDCEKLFSDALCTTETTLSAVTLAEIAHTAVHHNAVSATCVSEGNIEYWECSVCGGLFSDALCTVEIELEDTVISEVAHTAVHHNAVPSTTTEQGNIEYWTCSECLGYFLDAECTRQTTANAVKLPLIVE